MFSDILSKRSLSVTVLSVACLALLSSCNYIDAVHNAIPKGYTHHTTKPLSEPRMTHHYDSDVNYKHETVQGQLIMHKDKVDQLLEQIKPTLRTVIPGDKVFLVSEQKDRDFDDALRLGLRNMGIELDLTSMARYQLIYTNRPARKKDFEGMSIEPSHQEVSKLHYYALNFVDTVYGSPIANAYLIPNYYGFKVPEGYETVAQSAPTALAPSTPSDAAPLKAQPVMDNSPMLAPVEEAMQQSEAAPAMPVENASYNKVYSLKAASSMPMAITDSSTTDITAK